MRALLARYKGKEVDTAGDGFFATFDGPVRALRCAKAIADSVHTLGIEIRAGLHTGECEVIDNKVGGLAVNIGARICGLAGPSEVLASQTITDLVAGSGLRFDDRGAHQLKGVPGGMAAFRPGDGAGRRGGKGGRQPQGRPPYRTVSPARVSTPSNRLVDAARR